MFCMEAQTCLLTIRKWVYQRASVQWRIYLKWLKLQQSDLNRSRNWLSKRQLSTFRRDLLRSMNAEGVFPDHAPEYSPHISYTDEPTAKTNEEASWYLCPTGSSSDGRTSLKGKKIRIASAFSSLRQSKAKRQSCRFLVIGEIWSTCYCEWAWKWVANSPGLIVKISLQKESLKDSWETVSEYLGLNIYGKSAFTQIS